MISNPLGEVFGFPINNTSDKAMRFRKSKLCPYNNISPNCTKDKANDPLGVCSIMYNSDIAITCPVRFRQDWTIASDAAEFFFEDDSKWTSLSEIRLNDANGKSAGNIDLVLVKYNQDGKLIDFGAVEIQAVYISGNVREPFKKYMEEMPSDFLWESNYNYPKPDYLSSSRKRLVPQLMFKGGILNSWKKKIAIVIHEGFYKTLPAFSEVKKEDADIAWFIYGLDYIDSQCCYNLVKRKVVYTTFTNSLNKISRPSPGRIEEFIESLQEKLDKKLESELSPEVANPIELFFK